MAQRFAILLLLPSIAGAVNLRRGLAPSKAEAPHKTLGLISTSTSASFVAAVDAKIERLLLRTASDVAEFGKGPSVADLAADAVSQIDPKTAMEAMVLPDNIVNLVRQRGNNTGGEDPAIVEAAVEHLNVMIEAAQVRLDKKAGGCSEYKVKADQSLVQINADLDRLAQQLGDTQTAITSSKAGISNAILEFQQQLEEEYKELGLYTKSHDDDQLELNDRQANLDVGTFILRFTMCPSMLLQGTGADYSKLASTGFQTCTNGTGTPPEISFEDPQLMKAANKLTSEGQQLLFSLALTHQQGLGQDLDDGNDNAPSVRGAVVLAQLPSGCAGGGGSDMERLDVSDTAGPGETKCEDLRSASCCTCNSYKEPLNVQDMMSDVSMKISTHGLCTYVPSLGACRSLAWKMENPDNKTQEVCGQVMMPGRMGPQRVEKPSKQELKSANRCSGTEPDCGVLHDLFAALWGEMKDLVEETTARMTLETTEWDRLKANINALKQSIAGAYNGHNTGLAEYTGVKSTETAEQKLKGQERTEVQTMLDVFMADCHTVMREILVTEICGITAVRNNMIAENLPGEPVPVDCSFTDWVEGDCNVPCDDNLVGGVQKLEREIINRNSKRGTGCPVMKTARKCNQKMCEVDCILSEWSTYDKCTKGCGGGSQARSRNLDVEPKNGGKACDTQSEMRSCNSGDCDVKCELADWSPFGKCSKSCNGGYMEKVRRKATVEKGDGFCARRLDATRVQRKACDNQKCTGDEICNTKVDLVIAIDASGSVTEVGFDIMKDFAARVVQRMGAKSRVAVVQFGNGVLDSSNVVSDALEATDGFENDLKGVASKIDGLVLKKGFTNLAQAIMKAKDVSVGARQDADNVVLVITDGAPSFKFSTKIAVDKLRKSSRLMLVHVKKWRKEEVAVYLKSIVSEPWSANYRHIDGKQALKGAYDKHATNLVADICKKVSSPLKMKLAEKREDRLKETIENLKVWS